jgi:NADPH:quinone reductase-like Zn-dependent oxidoreductase
MTADPTPDAVPLAPPHRGGEPNAALWLPKPGADFTVGPAPYTPPAAGEVVVRARAVAVNPVDGLPGYLYRLGLPWLAYPAVVGSDVAGEVVEVGPGVSGLRPGQRVLGHAVGVDRSRNRAAEGAFQRYVVLRRQLVSPIPDTLPFAQAAVLPLALSTAATGLFQPDHLGLALPSAGTPAPDRDEAVLVWGGSTSVGSNAIQLARAAGYHVLATASPHNAGYLRELGAAEAVDRHSPTAAQELLRLAGDRPLAGALAVGDGSLRKVLAFAAGAAGGARRVASTQPAPLVRLAGGRARRRGVRLTAVWGGTLMDNEVGPAVYTRFLPAALASGGYRAAPDATVVGDGLARVPEALALLKSGVSARKLVVTV